MVDGLLKHAQLSLTISSLVVLLILVGVVAIGVVAAGAQKPECNDSKDNDGDGRVDLADAGCSNRGDNDETNCGDGVCEGGETATSCPSDCRPADSCSDTDGGSVITVFGTVSGYSGGAPYSNSDYCADAGSVFEYYCSGNYMAGQQQSCGTDGYAGSNYCVGSSVYRNYTDYSCSSGACGSSTNAVLQQTCTYGCANGACNPPPDWCSDSDGGYNLPVNGTVIGVQNGNPFSYADYCPDSTSLVEYTCFGSGNTPYPYNVNCAASNYTGCGSGACV